MVRNGRKIYKYIVYFQTSIHVSVNITFIVPLILKFY